LCAIQVLQLKLGVQHITAKHMRNYCRHHPHPHLQSCCYCCLQSLLQHCCLGQGQRQLRRPLLLPAASPPAPQQAVLHPSAQQAAASARGSQATALPAGGSAGQSHLLLLLHLGLLLLLLLPHCWMPLGCCVNIRGSAAGGSARHLLEAPKHLLARQRTQTQHMVQAIKADHE
jgi:hypothetical protein